LAEEHLLQPDGNFAGHFFWEFVVRYMGIPASDGAFAGGLVLHAHFFGPFGTVMVGDVWPISSVFFESDWVEEIAVRLSHG
jgi:hypothetical protein